MNLALPPEFDVVDPQQMLDDIYAAGRKSPVRRRLPLVIVLVVVLAVAAAGLSWFNRPPGPSVLGTPSASASASSTEVVQICPADWTSDTTPLFDEHRLPAPTLSSTRQVEVVAVGPGVVFSREVWRSDYSVIVTHRLGREEQIWSQSETWPELGEERLTDIATDGDFALGTRTTPNAASVRSLWRIGEPQAGGRGVDEFYPTADEDSALWYHQGIQNGYLWWLAPTQPGSVELVTQPTEALWASTGWPRATGEPVDPIRQPVPDAVSVAAQDDSLWVLSADSTISLLRLDGRPGSAAPEVSAPVSALASDGHHVLVVTGSGIEVHASGQTTRLLGVDTTTGSAWQISGDWVSYTADGDPGPNLLLNTRTGQQWELPASVVPGAQPRVFNGSLIVYDDLQRPVVLPLDEFPGVAPCR